MDNQQTITKKEETIEEILERSYTNLTLTKRRDQEFERIGLIITYPKKHEETPFHKQTPQKIQTIKEFEKEKKTKLWE